MRTTRDGQSPAVSVIIVTHDSQADIEPCLTSLRRAAVPGSLEIILVDSGSTDGTVRAARATGVPTRVIRLRNVGFAAAANAGAAEALGALLFFLNPDTAIGEEALPALVEGFCDVRVQVIGGMLEDPAAVPEQWQNVSFPSLRSILANHLWRRRSSHALYPVPRGPSSVPWVSGAALAIRRETFQRLGGFNERFFLYFEDVDLCWRVREHGGWVLLHPGVRILHRRGRSADQQERRQSYDRSQRLFLSFHQGSWERWLTLSLRFIVRRVWVILGTLVVGVPVALLAARLGAPGGLLVGVLAAVLVLTTALSPAVGILLLVGSLLAGQSWRITLGNLGVTATDLVLLLVLVAGVLAVVRQQRLGQFLRTLAAGWWVPAALLPGLLLAAERLALPDLAVAAAYALRLGAALLLIPVLRAVQVSPRFTHVLLIASALLLVLIGLGQLWALPVLPPEEETLAADLFLGRSLGGWDPHRYRLLATWLDPNFLGGFFVLGLALVLGRLPSVLRERRPTAYWLLPAASLLLVGLVLTQSRASVVALLGLAALFLVVGPVRRILLPLATGLMFALLFLPQLSGRLLVAPRDDPTVQLRLRSLEQATRHIERYPWFGAGYNAYAFEQLAVGNLRDLSLHSRAGADNAVATILATAGFWGAVLLIVGILWTLRSLLLRVKRGEAAALGVLLAFFSLLVHTQFVQSITYIHLLVPLALLLGSVGDERWGTRDEG